MITYGRHVGNETPDSLFSVRPVYGRFFYRPEVFSTRPLLDIEGSVELRLAPAVDWTGGCNILSLSGEPRAATITYIELYNTLTILAASDLISTTSPRGFAFVCNVPAVRRSHSSRLVCLRNASKRGRPPSAWQFGGCKQSFPVPRPLRGGRQLLFSSP